MFSPTGPATVKIVMVYTKMTLVVYVATSNWQSSIIVQQPNHVSFFSYLGVEPNRVLMITFYCKKKHANIKYKPSKLKSRKNMQTATNNMANLAS